MNTHTLGLVESLNREPLNRFNDLTPQRFNEPTGDLACFLRG